MKTLLTLITLFSFFFPLTSSAEIVYCNNQCFKLKQDQLATIKGLLYEITEEQDKQTNKTFLPHVAETIVWMEQKHKEKKIYKLKDFKKDDRARLITKSIDFILDVISGKTIYSPEKTIIRLTNIGYSVVAEYKETIVNKKTVVEYKLQLKEADNEK